MARRGGVPRAPLLLPPLLLLLLLAGAARSAVLSRFSDAACSVATGKVKVFGGKCYGSSAQHGAVPLNWVGFLGHAPIVESWALQSCAPGTMTLVRWDTPGGADDFCAGASTSSVTYSLNFCTFDPLNAGATGGNYAMLVDDTCRMDPGDPFFVANMYYSTACSQTSFLYRATYMTFKSGFCELVSIPQFVDGTTSKRAVVTNNTNGGYLVQWYPVDSNCSGAPITSFAGLDYRVCINIYSLGGAVVYTPPDYPTVMPPAGGGPGGGAASGAAALAAAEGAAVSALLLVLAAGAALVR